MIAFISALSVFVIDNYKERV